MVPSFAIRRYNTETEWTWKQWQWRGTPYSPNLQGWSLAIRLFCNISRAFVGGGGLLLWRDAVGVFYSPSQSGSWKNAVMEFIRSTYQPSHYFWRQLSNVFDVSWLSLPLTPQKIINSKLEMCHLVWKIEPGNLNQILVINALRKGVHIWDYLPCRQDDFSECQLGSNTIRCHSYQFSSFLF